MSSWNAVTWDVARAGGFVSYGLVTLAVSLGLVLRNRWQTRRWPRLVTNELHGYVSLLALVFIAVHVTAVAVDPFTRFGLAAVLVPFATQYRTLWMSLGIVGLYLLLAVWVSSKLRARLGHRAWRLLHLLSFAVYSAATLHGLGTGSDTRTVWGALTYAVSVGLVGSLLAVRLVAPAGAGSRPRPLLAAAAAVAVIGGVFWSATGPFAADWSARAGGRRPKPVGVASIAASPRVEGLPRAVVRPPFSARFAGQLTAAPLDAEGRVTIRIDGALSGATRDHLEILMRGVPLEDGGVVMEQSRVRMGTATPLYRGAITALRGSRLVVALHSGRQTVMLGVRLRILDGGRVTGVVRGTASTAGTA
jgi:hypothetical protein